MQVDERIMKKVYRYMSLVIALVLIVLPISAVLAQTYTCSVNVVESDGNSYSQLPITLLINNQYLADSGYISSTGLDTRVRKGGTQVLHMLADDKLVFLSPINANESFIFDYTFGNAPLEGFHVIPGYGGSITVPDDASLEMGNHATLKVKGYTDITSGSDKNLVYKEDAFRLYVSDTGEITAAITGGSSVTATGLSSGVFETKVVLLDNVIYIYIDDILKDSTSMAGVGVPDNGNAWQFMQNSSMLSLEYVKLETE